jgi:membrane protein implicated in regulation of membrane protease activity
MTIGFFYTLCLGVGLGYAVLSAALGWLFDSGGDVHVDAAGHLDAGHISPISGTTIATFVTGFGAGGTLAHHVLDWAVIPGMLLATASGLVLAGAAFAVLEFIFSRTQAGSEYSTDDVVGCDAEVITSIRENGIGEIAYVVKGQRERLSARTGDGTAIAKGSAVVVESLAGSTAYVRRKQ